MEDDAGSVNLSRRKFLMISWLSLAAGMVLAGCQYYPSPVVRTPRQVQFTSWGQANVTLAELDLPFQDYAFFNPTGIL